MLNLPIDIWFVFVGAGALFLIPLVVIYIADRILMMLDSDRRS